MPKKGYEFSFKQFSYLFPFRAPYRICMSWFYLQYICLSHYWNGKNLIKKEVVGILGGGGGSWVEWGGERGKGVEQPSKHQEPKLSPEIRSSQQSVFNLFHRFCSVPVLFCSFDFRTEQGQNRLKIFGTGTEQEQNRFDCSSIFPKNRPRNRLKI